MRIKHELKHKVNKFCLLNKCVVNENIQARDENIICMEMRYQNSINMSDYILHTVNMNFDDTNADSEGITQTHILHVNND